MGALRLGSNEDYCALSQSPVCLFTTHSDWAEGQGWSSQYTVASIGALGGKLHACCAWGMVGRASHTKVLKTRGLAVASEGGGPGHPTSISIWTCS